MSKQEYASNGGIGPFWISVRKGQQLPKTDDELPSDSSDKEGEVWGGRWCCWMCCPFTNSFIGWRVAGSQTKTETQVSCLADPKGKEPVVIACLQQYCSKDELFIHGRGILQRERAPGEGSSNTNNKEEESDDDIWSHFQTQHALVGALVYIRMESIEMGTIRNRNCELKDVIPFRGRSYDWLDPWLDPVWFNIWILNPGARHVPNKDSVVGRHAMLHHSRLLELLQARSEPRRDTHYIKK